MQSAANHLGRLQELVRTLLSLREMRTATGSSGEGRQGIVVNHSGCCI